MKLKHLYLLTPFILLLSVLLAYFSDRVTNTQRYPSVFMQVLHGKMAEADRLFDRLATNQPDRVEKVIGTANRHGIILLRYERDSLSFWSSNTIPIRTVYPEEELRPRVVQIYNSYYYVYHQRDDSVQQVALIVLKHSYNYENKFLQSGFPADFMLPGQARIGFYEKHGLPVYDTDSCYLFSILLANKVESTPRLLVATLLFFIGVFLLGYLLLRYFNGYIQQYGRRWRVVFMLVGVVSLRLAQLLLCWHLDAFLLFDPYLYADSLLTPSLGDLILNALWVLFTAVVLFNVLDGIAVNASMNRRFRIALYTGLNLLCLAFFLYAQYYVYSLIFNSKIDFGLNTAHKISPDSLFGYLVIGINFGAFFLIAVRVLKLLVPAGDVYLMVQIFVFTSVVVLGGVVLLGGTISATSMVFYAVLMVVLAWSVYRQFDLKTYSYLVLWLLLFSTYLFVEVSSMQTDKEKVIRSSLALSLANEHDPVAEFLFESLSRQIEADTLLSERFAEVPLDMYAISDYIKGRYFSGFWNKYELHTTLCFPDDSVLVESPDLRWYHCYDFFDAIVEKIGYNLPDTRFYYLDYLVGRISYLGRFPFTIHPNSSEVTLFIELDAKINSDFLGYPELLLDERLHEQRLIDNYSYAKYFQGSLVRKFGRFSYSFTPRRFGASQDEFSEISFDNYHHLLYHPDPESLIVISKPQSGFLDYVVGFSYIFLCYFLLLLLVIAGRKIYFREWYFLSNLRNRIQMAILGVMLVSLLLIAGSTVWLNSRNFRETQYNLLQEKIQSVLIEMSHKLSREEVLSPSWFSDRYMNLNALLIKFSEIFYTDINLYSPEGTLLATSRFEVFKQGLQGERMDPMAYDQLRNQQRAQFIHNENIGKLNYLSAYVPFFNKKGQLLAYLNLPYFTKQKDYQASLSAALIAIVNSYVILILLAILVTVLISEQITRPLAMLQMRFKNLKLGNKYEQIHYKRNDEIGNLVAEYNHMVQELERSVSLLARTERESAWREMAKQIAHEIKNPLTPMRLSIQQLNRVWKSNPEKFGEYLGNVTATLIEQIDNLSNIATSFSDFAKMPLARIEKLDLAEVIRKAVQLFESEPDFERLMQLPEHPVYVDADREQLARVFINLIKNGAQSIPDGRKGKIVLSLKTEGQQAVVRISDNGNGIPREIQSKLFMPNFTTKTSGMGLGLAIVQNSIHQLQGEITFETELGKGTVFSIRLPLSKGDV